MLIIKLLSVGTVEWDAVKRKARRKAASLLIDAGMLILKTKIALRYWYYKALIGIFLITGVVVVVVAGGSSDYMTLAEIRHCAVEHDALTASIRCSNGADLGSAIRNDRRSSCRHGCMGM